MSIADKKNAKDPFLPLRLWNRFLVGFILTVGILALAGWAFNINILKHPVPGWVAMNPTTALCFILSGLSLALLSDKNRENRKNKAGIVLAYIVLAIGLIKLGSLITGIDIPIDSLIFYNKIKHDLVGNISNRMAPATFLDFLVTGIALLFLNKKTGKLKTVSQYSAILIGLVSIFSLLGYLFNEKPFDGSMNYNPMAFQTASGFLLLALAILFSQPEKGFMLEFSGHQSGAIIARKLIPAVIIIPVVLGLLRIYLTNKGFVSGKMGDTLNTLTYIIIFLVLLLIITYELNRKDALRSQTERALRNSLEEVSEYKNALQYQSQAISRTNAIIEFDTEGTILNANENFLGLFGYSLREIKGKHHSILLRQEHVNTIEYQHFWDDLKKGAFHIGEFERKTKDGQIIWILGSYNMIYDLEGQFIKVLKIVTDITYRKKLETEIKEFNDDLQKKVKQKTEEIIQKEEQYRFLLQNMREGIQVIGFDWRYLFVNNSALSQSKYSREELVGHTMMEKYPGIEKTEMFNALRTCMKERITKILENEFTFPDGTKEWYELSIQPVPEGIFILSIDITNRKKTEEKLREYAAELKSSNTELERFAYVASHDLQEPLRMVSSFLSLLEKRLEETLDQTSRQYIDFAVNGAVRMKVLIQDLLAYSRVGSNIDNFAPVDINEVIHYVTKILEEDIQKNHAAITVKPVPVITANHSLISQLFLNLIANALKYHGDNHPIIEIGCKGDQGKWTFYVKDNGIGIDPRFFDKIFIIFQRLHNKTEYSGTGIGLAICKKIADIHKGEIWVDSIPGQGSTFHFSIPKTKILDEKTS